MEYCKEMTLHQGIINVHLNVISFMLLEEQGLGVKIHPYGQYVHGVGVD